MRYEGKIIDAHMHLWDYDSGNYPWLDSELPGGDLMLGNHERLRRNYLVKDYNKDIGQHNIEKSIHIQVFGYPENPVLEANWLQALSDKFFFPHAIVGYVDLCSNEAEANILKHKVNKSFCGIRNVLCYHANEKLRMIINPNIFSDAQWLLGFSLLEKYDLSFDVQIFDNQIPELTKLARQYSNTKIIVNHLAWPTDFSESGFNIWCDHIKQLAKEKNVYIKISALGCIFKSLKKDLIRPYLLKVLDSFGTERCLVGSNFPVDGLFFTFDELYNFYKDIFIFLDECELQNIFYLNAKKIYKL